MTLSNINVIRMEVGNKERGCLDFYTFRNILNKAVIIGIYLAWLSSNNNEPLNKVSVSYHQMLEL